MLEDIKSQMAKGLQRGFRRSYLGHRFGGQYRVSAVAREHQDLGSRALNDQ
jgi:hypothetical protein